MRQAGIYAITHRDKVYIGSTVDLQKREQEHRNLLRRGAHHSPHLQRVADKYGIEALRFAVWHYTNCPGDELRRIEQRYIDREVSMRGRDKVMNATLSVANPMDDPEVRERQAAGVRQLYEDPEWREQHAQAMRRLSESDNWRANQLVGARKRVEDPGWSDSRAAATRKMVENQTWRTNVAAAAVERTARHYSFLDPNNKPVYVYNLSAFCRERGLDASAMAKVASGKRAHYKSWRRYGGDD